MDIEMKDLMGNLAVQLISLGEIADWVDARKVIARSTDLVRYEPRDPAAWDENEARFLSILGKSALN